MHVPYAGTGLLRRDSPCGGLRRDHTASQSSPARAEFGLAPLHDD